MLEKIQERIERGKFPLSIGFLSVLICLTAIDAQIRFRRSALASTAIQLQTLANQELIKRALAELGYHESQQDKMQALLDKGQRAVSMQEENSLQIQVLTQISSKLASQSRRNAERISELAKITREARQQSEEAVGEIKKVGSTAQANLRTTEAKTAEVKTLAVTTEDRMSRLERAYQTLTVRIDEWREQVNQQHEDIMKELKRIKGKRQ